ncbi:MAG TPA: hypothetical protein VM912_07030 [Terriglobales bacterium]|nr:hypothetical protein [Terriglobales bacterium]
MHRLLTIAAASVISAGMAFGQATATDQSPSAGTQPTSNTVNTNPNRKGTSPSAQSGAVADRPSAPNQALPGNANPANAATNEGRANRQAVNPNQKGATAAPELGNPGDNSDNNGMAKDDTGNNAASGRGSNTITNPGTAGTVQWFWIALAVIIGVVLIGVLASRNRARANIEPTDPALRATDTRRDFDRKEDERIRRAG